jgi:hypothetical protein
MAFFRTAHGWNTVLFTAFLFAILLVYTGVWQLAFFAGYAGGFLGKRARRDFLLTFLGVALAWGGHLLWIYLFTPAGALASVFAQILGLSAGAGIVVPVLTLLIGGLTGALGGLVGAYAGQLAFPSPPATPVRLQT